MGYRKRLQRLWAEDPFCNWCGIETFLKEPDEPIKPYHATFDHFKHKSKRQTDDDSGVLACYRCNQNRGREAEAQAPKLIKNGRGRIQL